MDIPISHGPDHERSPHAYDKEVDYEPFLSESCMAQRFVVRAVALLSAKNEVDYEPIFQDLAMQAATDPPPDGDVLHPTRQQLLALRIGPTALRLNTWR